MRTSGYKRPVNTSLIGAIRATDEGGPKFDVSTDLTKFGVNLLAFVVSLPSLPSPGSMAAPLPGVFLFLAPMQ